MRPVRLHESRRGAARARPRVRLVRLCDRRGGTDARFSTGATPVGTSITFASAALLGCLRLQRNGAMGADTPQVEPSNCIPKRSAFGSVVILPFNKGDRAPRPHRRCHMCCIGLEPTALTDGPLCPLYHVVAPYT